MWRQPPIIAGAPGRLPLRVITTSVDIGDFNSQASLSVTKRAPSGAAYAFAGYGQTFV